MDVIWALDVIWFIYDPLTYLCTCVKEQKASLQSVLYENHCTCYKKLNSRSCSVLFTLTYFLSYK